MFLIYLNESHNPIGDLLMTISSMLRRLLKGYKLP